MASAAGAVPRLTVLPWPDVRTGPQCASLSELTASRAIGAVVARFVHTEEVTGSNPVSPTNGNRP